MEGLATYAGLRCMEILQGTTPQPELFFVQGFQGFADMSHLKDAQLYMLEKLMRGEVNVNNDRFHGLFHIAVAPKMTYPANDPTIIPNATSVGPCIIVHPKLLWSFD